MKRETLGGKRAEEEVEEVSCEGQGLGGGLGELDVVPRENGAGDPVNSSLHLSILPEQASKGGKDGETERWTQCSYVATIFYNCILLGVVRPNVFQFKLINTNFF